MNFTWEFFPLFVGFIAGYLLYNRYMFRGGGVIIVPLLAIYFVKFPMSFPVLIAVSFVTYIALEFVYSKYIVYGRRLLYLSLAIGMSFILFFETLSNTMGWYPMILPGLFAYNMHRENNSNVDKLKSFGYITGLFAVLVVISFGAIYFI